MPLAAADILLWKDRNLSAGLLAAATLAWYLFEVVEYSIVPLVCQIAVLAMLVVFIWSNAAPLLNMYETSLLHERKKNYRMLPKTGSYFYYYYLNMACTLILLTSSTT